MDNGAVQVLQALIESRKKSVEAIDAACAALEKMAVSAKVAKAALAFRSQVKVKRQRRELLVAELEAYRAELGQLQALEAELPGLAPVQLAGSPDGQVDPAAAAKRRR